jgi:cytidine deaminase
MTSELIRAAVQAREHAMALHSGFRVGAAIESADGKVFTGCNIESASYGLTVCAERVALWKAISEGAREFKAIAVVSDAAEPAPPCGSCRQVLWEYCGDIQVALHSIQGKSRTTRLSALLPEPFDRRYLSTGRLD